MKKILIATVLIFSISLAQDESSSPWSVYGGITSASMSEADGRTNGLSLGISYTLNEKWSVGGGLSHRGGSFNVEDDEAIIGGSDSYEMIGNAIEFWSSYSLMQSDSFSLSTGLIYAHIYEFEVNYGSMSISESETDNDYGLYLNSTIPLQDNLGLNIGYYMGLRDIGDNEKFNNLWLEVGYSF